MCVPKPPAVVAPADPVPSMQAASSLTLANDSGGSRGAAQLGRLALRVGGGGSSAQSAAAPAPAPPPPPTQVAPAAAQQSNQQPSATAAPYSGVGTTPGSLAGQRFGIFNGLGFL